MQYIYTLTTLWTRPPRLFKNQKKRRTDVNPLHIGRSLLTCHSAHGLTHMVLDYINQETQMSHQSVALWPSQWRSSKQHMPYKPASRYFQVNSLKWQTASNSCTCSQSSVHKQNLSIYLRRVEKRLVFIYCLRQSKGKQFSVQRSYEQMHAKALLTQTAGV